jgi:two-component system, OmpR family, response regulator
MNEHSGHLLVVDDQPEICELIRGYLSGEGYTPSELGIVTGYRVATAHDGAGMRQIMAHSSVDLVMLNWMQRGEDGLTLARSLRQETSVGIIILSGRGEIPDQVLTYETGADAFIPKPFHLRLLRAVVQSVLRRAVARSSRLTKYSELQKWLTQENSA